MLFDLLLIFVGIPLLYAIIINIPKVLGRILDKLNIGPSTSCDLPDQAQRLQAKREQEKQEREASKHAIGHLEQGRA